MIFNGIDFNNKLRILDLKKSLLPQIKNKYVDIPGKAGAKFMRNELSPISINIKCELKGVDKEDLENEYLQLANELYTQEPAKLILNNSPEYYYLAILDDMTPIKEIRHFSIIDLSFLCLDPIKYSLNAITLTDISNQELINLGTRETKAIITVTLNSNEDNLKITLDNTGEYIYIEDNLEIGDVITIDLIESKVLKNQDLIMEKLHFESDFFSIPSGPYKLISSSGVMDIEYQERWL